MKSVFERIRTKKRKSLNEEKGGWPPDTAVLRKMSEYHVGMLLGVGTGVLVGILVIIFMLKITKKDGKMKCEYDERQAVLRGNGYKYGFFTIAIFNIIYWLVSMCLPVLPVDTGTAMVLSALIGVGVQVTYCIWHDCYFSLNENRRRVMVAFVFIGAVNIVLGVNHLLSGQAIENGVMNYRCVNLFCGLLFVEIFAVLLLKHLYSGRDCEQ